MGSVLAHVPLRLYELCIRRDVIGLCYHVVADRPPAHVAHVCPVKTRALFEADLEYLSANYEIISYQELCRRRSSARRAPRRPAVVITFDDGFRECVTEIRPILQKYRVPATFFVATDFLDNARMFYRHKVSLCIERLMTRPDSVRGTTLAELSTRHGLAAGSPHAFIRWMKGQTLLDEPVIDEVCSELGIDSPRFLKQESPYLTSDEVRSLASDGFTIGAHGRSHVRLSLLRSRAELEEEIVGSCRIVADRTGAKTVPFAFPFSGDGVSRDILRSIRASHPVVGLMFDRRGLQSDTEFIVQRIVADSCEVGQPARSNLSRLFRSGYQRHARARATEPFRHQQVGQVSNLPTSSRGARGLETCPTAPWESERNGLRAAAPVRCVESLNMHAGEH